ncbi:MAG: HPF/RaiA family ribosome-associated protein [bacterium]|nr:HPF/RaiA family ribosome-associated protein [bacterium]
MMEIQIEAQHATVRDALRDMIMARLEKLNEHHGDIIHARVSLVKSIHHQHGSDEARIFLSMSRRKMIQATKVGKTLDDAIINALDVLQRELSDYRSKRRELNKQRLKAAKLGPQVIGKVVEVFLDKGYGFVDIGEDEEVRFTRKIIAGDAFESITEGMAVEMDIVEDGLGYEATRLVRLSS